MAICERKTHSKRICGPEKDLFCLFKTGWLVPSRDVYFLAAAFFFGVLAFLAFGAFAFLGDLAAFLAAGFFAAGFLAAFLGDLTFLAAGFLAAASWLLLLRRPGYLLRLGCLGLGGLFHLLHLLHCGHFEDPDAPEPFTCFSTPFATPAFRLSFR